MAAAKSDPLGRWGLLLALAPFALLLFASIWQPHALVFDEIHYIPAADALASLSDDLNWEHPPVSKWLMGVGAHALSRMGIASGPASYRLVAVIFGIWALASVASILRDLGFSGPAILCAAALTGANGLWFVQSRTAMPDVFAVAFALAGVRHVRRGGNSQWLGWGLLGLAMGSKWSAAPYCVLALWWARGPVQRRVYGVVLAMVAYAAAFLPLALLERHATPVRELVHYQFQMLSGFTRVSLDRHPYASSFWQWPTLLRPAWYHFERTLGGDRYLWAGGNPLLYACALPTTIWIAARALRRTATAEERTIALLYWAPLLFWAALRRTQIYYYFFGCSLWLGPSIVWAVVHALETRSRRAALAVMLSLTAACVLVFLWFAPLFTAWLEPVDTYQRYMWLRGWR